MLRERLPLARFSASLDLKFRTLRLLLDALLNKSVENLKKFQSAVHPQSILIKSNSLHGQNER